MLSLLSEDDANAVAQVRRSTLVQLGGIRPNQGDERAFVFQHRDLGYLGRAAINPLEILGDHLLAAAQHQEFLGTAGDEQKTIAIDEAQITRAKPPVGGKGFDDWLPDYSNSPW